MNSKASQSNSSGITILFDFDGTLVDTMSIIEMVVRNGMERLGNKLDEEKTSKLIKNLELDDDQYAFLKNSPKGGKLIYFQLFHYLGRFLGLSRIKAFIFMIYCLINVPKNYKFAKPFDGVPEMIKKLHDERILIGIVTSARRKDTDKLFKNYINFFDVIITREMVRSIKPSPEGILKAIELLKSDIKKSVYIGDFPHDIMAAKEAGIMSIGILTGSVSESILAKENPTKIYPNVVDAVQWFIEENSN
ncbi:MAG: HAD family hydrolase [Candidatus Hodarchaeales archaeon]|jgi:phosphoglycolate phosphatase-like HAD superfamily hydrolase